MIKRKLSRILKKYSSQYPIVTVTGPRQSGKTTLCKDVFTKYDYVSLENHDVLDFAQEDPRAFLNQFSKGVILDEFQKAPDLASYIQGIVDENKQPGQFILTGSENLKLSQNVSQSLAGRTAILKLLPFSLDELKEIIKEKKTDEILFSGFYPRIYDQHLDPYDALNFYIETYVERDVRNLSKIHNLSLFKKFLKLCAGRVGQLLNLNNISNEVGISHTTAREWLTLLEATYIVTLLPPYYKNYNKRIIKSPKLYFYDVGLAANLLGIKNPSQLSRDPLRGGLFENMIVINYLKEIYAKGDQENLYFFRDSQGNEIDVIIDTRDGLEAIEIKSAETISPDFQKGLNYIEKISTDTILKKSIVYGGKDKQNRSWGQVLPYRDLS